MSGVLTGTYTPNSDVTITNALGLDMGATMRLAAAPAEGGQSMQLIATDYKFPSNCGCNLGGAVFAGTARAGASGSATLNGIYGFRQAIVPNNVGGTGTMVLDSAGNFTVNLTYVAPSDAKTGTPSTPLYFSLTGIYTINPDGTGVVQFPAVEGVSNAQSHAFVITDNGSGFFFMQLNRPGNGVQTGAARLQ
jgi:hypothetical protein